MAGRIGKEEDAPSAPWRAGLVAAAAASPFAGLIGQEAYRSDPHRGAPVGSKFQSLEELSRVAQPGDVVLGAGGRRGFFSSTITPVSGTRYYHVQPVLGRRDGYATSVEAGDFGYSAANRGMTPEQVKAKAGTLHSRLYSGGYTDSVLLRPKNISEAQVEKYTEALAQRATQKYDMLQAVRAWARDMFVPKGSISGNSATLCRGNTCSSMPAMALEQAGVAPIVVGKGAKNVMPQDFLRSSNYDVVGHYSNGAAKSGVMFRKVAPLATRAALGAGLAAGAYTLTDSDPEVQENVLHGSAAAVGAGASIAAVDEIVRRRAGTDWGALVRAQEEVFPGLHAVYDQARNGTPGKALRGWALRRAPVGLAGAAAGIGTSALIAHQLRKAGNKSS